MTSRLEVVVERLALDDGDDVAEIGCGHGVAATLVLDRLTAGTYTGIDRSAKMIAAATRRNAVAVSAGRATFVVAAIEQAGAIGPVDCLFAARVAALTRPRGLAAARQLLRPGGRLLLAFDAPDGARARSAADAAATTLGDGGFHDVRQLDAPFDRGVAALVTAVT